MRLQPSPVKLLAQELGIPVETPEKSRAPEFLETLLAVHADALVVASYGQILSQKVLDSARCGGINLHGSILPQYRGAAPIQRCILNGDTETGITIMQMDKGMDTGDIIEIVRTPIDPDETYGELQDRLAIIASALAVDWMPKIIAGQYTRQAQDGSLATIAPKIDKAEAELSVLRSAVGEYNRFRAFTPAPGAFLRTNLGTIRVQEARLVPLSGDPGAVLSTSPFTVAFQDGAIQLLQVQPEGKKRMSGKDFANGARMKPGSRLVD
jgi:methionyl-tRNA formyltransferase